MANLIDFDLLACDEILFESTSLQSYGYGIISQLVTKDREVSVSAKGVYAYLVSCAGNDKQTYPSQEKMCYDLDIKNPKTLRKYIRELQAKGFIRIVRTKKNNIQYRNVYLIAMDTRSIEVWKRQFEEGLEVDVEEALEKHKKTSKAKKDNKKDLPVGADKSTEETSSYTSNEIILNDSIPNNYEKENSKFMGIENLKDNNVNESASNIDINSSTEYVKGNEIDYELLALERCKREIEGFDDMPQFRKDVNVGIMLQRIARGE